MIGLAMFGRFASCTASLPILISSSSISLLVGGDDFFDARRVDAAVLHELLQADAGDLAAHRIEAADDHHARRVVDDHVHAGRLLEAADVAPLAADDAALHVVAWGSSPC